MLQTVSMPLQRAVLAEFGSWENVGRRLAGLGVDGLEGIWCGEDFGPDLAVLKSLVHGYHLTFFPDWLDFYREDKAALRRKFGSWERAESFYGGWGGGHLLEIYRQDLARARALGAQYVVFHVSDVSLEEGQTYRWLHSNEEVIDAALEVINRLLGDIDQADFDFLVENQWWPGFTFTEPAQTERLLAGIGYPRKGIMLDFGHLMNTNWELRDEAEGAAYVQAMLERHGELAAYVRGVHLHQSLSGAYAKAHTGRLPDYWPEDYLKRWQVSYSQVMEIDQHRPWSSPAVLPVLERLSPAYLTHELRDGWRALEVQSRLLRGLGS